MEKATHGEYIFPSLEDLPVVSGQPQGSLWGFFDKNGERDQLGSELLVPIERARVG